MQINFPRREISVKLVYYGPGLSGKTTNLEVVHKKAPPEKRSELTSIATDGDRTLFFDYMALDLGKVAGMSTKFQLYTVPGQGYYDATRKLVLQGADGVVFVADSQADKMAENLASLANLEANLREQRVELATFPLVLQWNKRDLPDVLPCEVLEAKLNRYGAPAFPAVAVSGEGVFPTLRKLGQLVLERLNQELSPPQGEGEPRPPTRREPRPATPLPPRPPGPLPREPRPAEPRPAARRRREPDAAPAPRPAPPAPAPVPARAPLPAVPLPASPPAWPARRLALGIALGLTALAAAAAAHATGLLARLLSPD